MPPEGRVRNDTADNLRTVLPLFRAMLVPLDLGFPTGYARVATAHIQHEQRTQSLFSSWRLSHVRQSANMLCYVHVHSYLHPFRTGYTSNLGTSSSY